MPGLSSPLRLKGRLCVDSLYMYTFVYLRAGEALGKQVALVEVRIIFLWAEWAE